jgi:hypothetical protein
MLASIHARLVCSSPTPSHWLFSSTSVTAIKPKRVSHTLNCCLVCPISESLSPEVAARTMSLCVLLLGGFPPSPSYARASALPLPTKTFYTRYIELTYTSLSLAEPRPELESWLLALSALGPVVRIYKGRFHPSTYSLFLLATTNSTSNQTFLSSCLFPSNQNSFSNLIRPWLNTPTPFRITSILSHDITPSLACLGHLQRHERHCLSTNITAEQHSPLAWSSTLQSTLIHS